MAMQDGEEMEAAGEYGDAGLADLAEMARSVPPRFGLPADTEVRLLNISENATYLVSNAGLNWRSILRINRAGYHSRDAICSELDWLRALREEHVIETAAPLKDRSGEVIHKLNSPSGGPDRYAVMFEYLAGSEPVVDETLPAWFERLGDVTARLHKQAQNWARPAGFTRHVWDTEAMFGERNLWGPWRESLGLRDAGATVIAQTINRVNSKLQLYGRGPTRFGLVHADLRLANLLVEGDHLKLIDFDDMGLSWFMYDFAASVSFIEDDPMVPVLLKSWVDGYNRIRTLSTEDLAVLPTLVIARRILLTAWLASHREIPLAQELGTGFTNTTVALANDYLEDRFLCGVV